MTLFLGRQQCINYHSTAYFHKKTDDIIVDVSTLKMGDRIGDMATVCRTYGNVSNGQYIFAVLDAKYRTSGQWSSENVNTDIPNFTYSSIDRFGLNELSATATQELISDNLDKYPAFELASQYTIKINGVEIKSVLPNAYELKYIYTNKDTLDTYDSSLSEFSQNSLSNWYIDGIFASWCCNEQSSEYAWALSNGGGWQQYAGKQGTFGVIPIFEIPL